MNAAAAAQIISVSQIDMLREARGIIHQEAAALEALARQLDTTFVAAVEAIRACQGSVIVSGMGKAGLIGRKISATLASTGTPSHFLHPAEAVHGDLGCVGANDLVLALSNSGETEEICRLLPILRRLEVPVIAMTATAHSTLASQADVVLTLGRLREAGPHGLAPTTSTTAMLALGDALALTVSRLRGFTPQQFAVFHPAGNLGARLRTVRQIMRQGPDLRVAGDATTIREVFVGLGKPGRRTGAVMLVDAVGRLSGIFTDSDLARLLEQRREFQLDRPISEVMTAGPVTVGPDAMLDDVVTVLSTKKVSELPVVDEEHRPVGLIDITDVIGLMPQEPVE